MQTHGVSSVVVPLSVLAIAAIVAVLTASALPWRWELPAYYVAVGLLLEWLGPLMTRGLQHLVRAVIVTGSAPIVLFLLYGDAWHTAPGFAHAAALSIAAIACGFLLARPLTRPRSA